ncbi:hypothetical protein NDU88_000756 [Pleurodeles waltl]|uniref:Uncharacterized protein n=1 Tax=Pleurodeles waltl TaxID=8319 RepID=A0AAV7SXF6_PLEWA|nr:hypothetical protein NDU88_000756 [Pleurodeles waltl]
MISEVRPKSGGVSRPVVLAVDGVEVVPLCQKETAHRITTFIMVWRCPDGEVLLAAEAPGPSPPGRPPRLSVCVRECGVCVGMCNRVTGLVGPHAQSEPLGKCLRGTMDSILCLRKHAHEGKRKGETRKEERPETEGTAGRQEEHNHQGREDDALNLEERRSPVGRNGEESLCEGALGGSNADESGKPQFWDSAARHDPGGM